MDGAPWVVLAPDGPRGAHPMLTLKCDFGKSYKGQINFILACIIQYMCQGLNSHYFHIIGDGHQPNSRGLYTHYKDSLLKVGGLPSPKKRDF